MLGLRVPMTHTVILVVTSLAGSVHKTMTGLDVLFPCNV